MRKMRPPLAEALHGFPIPYEQGLTSTEMLEACSRGDLDVFLLPGWQSPPHLARSKRSATRWRLCRSELHQDIILNDQMLIEPDGEVLLFRPRPDTSRMAAEWRRVRNAG